MSKNVRFDFNTSKVQKDFEKSFKKGRMKLKNEIVRDSSQFMPFRDGSLEKSVNDSVRKDDDKLVWNKIYARFLYYGQVMVGETSRKVWAKRGEKKVTIDKKLQFYKGRRAKAGPFWFENAKKLNKEKWVEIMKKIGGQRQ